MEASRRVAVLALAGLCLAVPSASRAQVAVVDAAANVSLAGQLVEQVKATADRAMDYANQVAQYVELANTYANAIENTVMLPFDAIARVQGIYARGEGLAMQASYVVGGEGTMMQRGRMLKGMGRSAGYMPGDTGRSLAQLRDQTMRQLEENERLLGLEDERRKIVKEMMTASTANSNRATGRMQAIQASAQVTASVAAQQQVTNDMLAAMRQDQLVKDAAAEADDAIYRAEMKAGFDQMRQMAAAPAVMNQSMATWGR